VNRSQITDVKGGFICHFETVRDERNDDEFGYTFAHKEQSKCMHHNLLSKRV